MYRRFVSLTVRSILSQKKRSFLTVIGIVIGITAVVSFISLGQGLEGAISQELETLGADKIYIVPGQSLLGSVAQMESALEDRDLDVIERARGVDQVGGMYYEYVPVQFRGEEQQVIVTGVPTDETQEMLLEANSFHTAEGRMIQSGDRSNVVIGNRMHAGAVFDRPVRLRNQLQIRDATFRVTGVLERTGDPEYDRGVVMELDRARDLLQGGDELRWVIAQASAGFEPETVAANIERELRQDRGLQEGEEPFTVATASDAQELFGSILGIVQAIVLGIASISLLVGGVGIMNTMYMSVTERTREIGIMKAVGAQDRQILVMFLIESAVIGIAGGVIGLVAGYGISMVIGRLVTAYAALPLTVTVSPVLVVGVLVFSAVTGIVSGVLPARNAAQLEPVDALRYE
jgi:putative ABC transport system permease protein